MSVEKSSNNGSIAGFYDVYFLGIVLVISGVLTYWNIGFEAGFWEYFFATVLITIAYMCLVLCLAEMISILPFSGGSYGFARVTMGPYLGFVIGCFDSVSNIIYVSSLVRGVCSFITNVIGPNVPHQYDPVYWLLCYVICLTILIPLGRWNFSFMTLVGAVTLVLPIVYVIATADEQNFQRYVTRQEDGVFFAQGMTSFMNVLPVPSWMYIGIDLVCLVCDDTKDAMHVVPKAIVAGMVTLIILAFLVMVTSAANAPGIVDLAAVAFPLNAGYSSAFHISDRMATILSIPGVFISTYSLIYAYGRQICALSRSKLLPSFLSWTTADNVPYMSLICGCGLGYAILVGLYYNDPDYLVTLNDLFLASQMGSFTVYIVSMISFIIFRYKYSAMERHYTNQLGMPSAVVGILIFLLAFVGVGFYQPDQYYSISMFTVFIGAVSAYYYLYARHTQCFSPEEQSILFAVYIIKSNSRKRTMWNWLGRKIHHAADRLDPTHKLGDAICGSGNQSHQGHGHGHGHGHHVSTSKQGSRHGSRPPSPKNDSTSSHFSAPSAPGPSTKSIVTTLPHGEVQLFTHEEEVGSHCDSKSRDINELDDVAAIKLRSKKEAMLSVYSSGENTAHMTGSGANSALRIVPMEDEELC